MINKQTTLDLNGPVISFTQQPSSEITTTGNASFSGLATAVFPTQNPVNPSTNTGSISYLWYANDNPLSDGTNSTFGFTVVGSATTTLYISQATSSSSNDVRFYLRADYIPSAYSQPVGSAVTVGTARSTGNAIQDPIFSNTATLTIAPIISIVSQPSSLSVAEGDIAEYNVLGSSSDGTPVIYRWLLNGSYLSDGSSGTFTVSGSNTSRLRISSSVSSSNIVSAEISHPTSSNGPLYSDDVLFNVFPLRAFISYQFFDESTTTASAEQIIDLTETQGNFIFLSKDDNTLTSTTFPSISIYAPERDIPVRITLAGAAGKNFNNFRGGAGGVTIFDVVLKSNVEYIAKLGGTFGVVDGDPIGGRNGGGGGASIFYRQSEVLVVSGGGGGAGSSGNGGRGGGARLRGESTVSGVGGVTYLDGELGITGTSPNLVDGGKLSSCTYGGKYWTDSYSPCEVVGDSQLRNSSGTIISPSPTIERGYKSGLTYRNNGGDDTRGGGGSGAFGGGASATDGGGGGSGYTNGEVTIISSQIGGNLSNQGYIRIELLDVDVTTTIPGDYWSTGLWKDNVGVGGPRGKDCAIDADKNLYVLGDFVSGGHNVASLSKFNQLGVVQTQKKISTGGSSLQIGGLSFDINALYCSFWGPPGRLPVAIKLDTLGNISWQRQFSTYTNPDSSAPDNYYYKIFSATIDSNYQVSSTRGSIYICGDGVINYYRGLDGFFTSRCGTVSKITGFGDILWTRFLGPNLTINPEPSGSGFDKRFTGFFSKNIVDSSGNVISFGRAFPAGGSGVLYPWIVKHNSSGTLLWSKIINNVVGFGFGVTIQDVETDSSGNIYCSLVGSGGGIYNALYTIKITSSGSLSWSSKVYNSSNINDKPSYSSILVDSFGNVYSGTYISGGYHLIKYNSSGTLQYQRKIQSTNGYIILSSKIDNSNNIYLVGYGYKYPYNLSVITKLKSDGSILGKYQDITISEGQLSPETTYLSPTLSSLNIDNISVPISLSSISDYKSEDTKFESDKIIYFDT